MRFLTRVMVLVSFFVLLASISMGFFGNLSMDEIKDTAIEKSSKNIIEKEKTKLLDLARERGEEADRYFRNIFDTIEAMAETVRSIEERHSNPSGEWNLNETGSFMEIEGELNASLSGLLSCRIDVYLAGQLGGSMTEATISSGDSVPVEWTYFNGRMNGYLKGNISSDNESTLSGTISGEPISLRGMERYIDGYVDLKVSGDPSGRDPGVLISGTFRGLMEGVMTGSLEGEIIGTVDMTAKGSIRGTLNGTWNDSPSLVRELIWNFREKNPSIESIFVGRERSWRTIDESESVFAAPSLGFIGFNCTKREWFTPTVMARSTIITRPYADARGLGLMVTVSTPLFSGDGKDLLFVIGADIKIDTIVEDLFRTGPYSTSYSFLVNEEGKMILSQDLDTDIDWTEKVRTEDYSSTENVDFLHAIEMIREGKGDIVELSVRQTERYSNETNRGFNYGPTTSTGEKFMAFSPIGLVNWSICIVVDREEIIEPIRMESRDLDASASRIISRFAMITIIILITASLLGAWIGYKTIRPVEKLTDTVRGIEGDSFPRDFPGSSRKDEIGELSRSFREMSRRIETYRDGMLREIHERKRMENEAKEEKKRAEFYLDLLSHDIGNLHQGIDTSLQLFEMKRNDPAGREKAFNIAREGIKRSITLVNNVLLISRMKRKTVELSPTDPREMMEKAAEIVRTMFPSKRIDIEIRCNDPNIRILAEPFLEQMFVNLLHNGIKFQNGERARIRVNIRSVGRGESVIIDIIDWGSGVPDHNKKRIFQRFEFLENERIRGTGIGLHLVKELADRYGATIEVRDRVRGDHTKGSLFRLRFRTKRTEGREKKD